MGFVEVVAVGYGFVSRGVVYVRFGVSFFF